MTEKEALKQKFFEAMRKSLDDGNSRAVYTADMIRALKDMARHDVVPDGRFGDDDCIIWEMLG